MADLRSGFDGSSELSRWTGLLSLLPVALIAFLTLWSGTLFGAAAAHGAIASHALILGFALLGALDSLDPLHLGRRLRALVPLTLSLVLLSWALSPVERAGRVGLLLLPAMLLTPAAASRCWSDRRAQRIAPVAISLSTLVIASIALVRWQSLSLPRASLPLGHHNLLALWLVLTLPLAVTGLRRAGIERWLALAAGISGLAAIAASRSLMGALALVAQLIFVALWWPWLRLWAGGLLAGVIAVCLPRLLSIAGASDLSALARSSYLQAAWRGFVERPWLGWGPGAVPWTVAEFNLPVPGIHPPSQVIGDLHCLPAQLAYELGLPAFLAAAVTGFVFLTRRWRECRRIGPSLSSAALLGLIGGAVFSLGSSPLAIPAIPFTAAVIAGAALPGRPPSAGARSALAGGLYVLVAALALVPLDLAHLFYDRARLSPTPSRSLQLIDRARRTDPRFPLYAARSAWLQADAGAVEPAIARQALEAAEMAPGLAPLWLAAGDLGHRAELPWAESALRKARSLDPLSPWPAFHLMTAIPDSPQAVALGIEALAGEARLARAVWWSRHPDLARAVSRRGGVLVAPEAAADSPATALLALTLDRRSAVSFSLYAFRRLPWPGRIAPVELTGP